MGDFHIIHPEKELTKYDPPITNREADKDLNEFKLRDIENVKFLKPTDTKNLQLRVVAHMKETEFKLNLIETKYLINQIIPPKLFEINDIVYKQRISCIPSNRAEIILLHQLLNCLEDQRQIHNYILCPLRREIYEDLFTEITRQISIQCFERGVLLKRIKNEIAMTLNTYKNIYYNFLCFNLRQFSLTQPIKRQKKTKLKELQNEINELKYELETSFKYVKSLEKEENSKNGLLINLHSQQIKSLKLLQNQLSTQLNDIITVLKTDQH